ncbi:hypothetical protein Tco_0476064 [Tanacetum coccineum]
MSLRTSHDMVNSIAPLIRKITSQAPAHQNCPLRKTIEDKFACASLEPFISSCPRHRWQCFIMTIDQVTFLNPPAANSVQEIPVPRPPWLEKYAKANFIKMNTASTSGSGTLLGNTITNPKEDLKGITTRSGVSYQGPAIPSTSSSSQKVMNRDNEVTKDTILPTNNGSTKSNVQSIRLFNQSQNPTSEPVVDPVNAPRPNQQTSIPFPSRRNDERGP